jgi:hypothetical protein
VLEELRANGPGTSHELAERLKPPARHGEPAHAAARRQGPGDRGRRIRRPHRVAGRMSIVEKGFAHERATKVLAEIQGVAAQYGVTSKDKEFLASLVERQQRTTSAKQEKWLSDIEHKVFTCGATD